MPVRLADRLSQFTPGSGKPSAASPASKSSSSTTNNASTNANADGADDNDTSSTSSFDSEADALSPMVDGNNEKPDVSPSPALSPFISRSASPTPITGGGMGGRAASPISFGYPYYSNVRDGYLSDSHTPTAIQG